MGYHVLFLSQCSFAKACFPQFVSVRQSRAKASDKLHGDVSGVSQSPLHLACPTPSIATHRNNHHGSR